MTVVDAAVHVIGGVRDVACIAAVVFLVRRGLWRRYPLLSVYLGTAALRSLVLVVAFSSGGKHAYIHAWLHSQPFVIASLASLVVEWYVVQARAISRRFFLSGWVAMAFFIAISAGFVYETASIAIIPSSASPQAILTVRYYESVGFLVVVLFRLAFRAIHLPGSENQRRYGTNLLILLGGAVVGALIGQWNQYWPNFIAQIFTVGSAIWAYTNWARFREEGERPGTGLPRPSDEEMQRDRAAFRGLLRRAWRDIRRRGRQLIVVA